MSYLFFPFELNKKKKREEVEYPVTSDDVPSVQGIKIRSGGTREHNVITMRVQNVLKI